MIRKIFISLTAFLVLTVNVYAINYDFTQNKINNTDSHSIIKKGEELYFSGEKDFVEDIELKSGDKITLLKWNSYADIRPKADPAVYNVCDVLYLCDGKEVARGTGFAEGELVYPEVTQKNGYEVKWDVVKSGEHSLTANAEYVLKDYNVTFIADGEKVSSTTYNINNTAVTEPAVPKKEHYNGKWEDYVLTYGDREINAVYTPIEYTVTFESKNEVIKKTFNIENMEIEEPEVPAIEGYTGKWEDYTLSLNNITVKAVYEIVEYEVTFLAENFAKTEKYTVANKNVTEPAVPEKSGYTGVWESYSLNLENITVKAHYTPIEYKAIFKAEDFEEEKIFTVENMQVEEPEVPEKLGYTGKWEEYTLTLQDTEIRAVYTPNKYKITFDASDEEIEVTYDGKYPELPTPVNEDVSKFFIGWYNGDELVAKDNKVNITEDVCLVAKWGNKPVYTVTYKNYYQDGTAMTDSVIEGEKPVMPKAPEKTGYKFLYWCTDSLGYNEYDFETVAEKDITLYPKWELVYYTVTFKADGAVVDTIKYTVENKKITNPSVPPKKGNTGVWESYTLTYGDIEVNAVYTPKTYTIHYLNEKGTETLYQINYTYGEEIDEPAVPEKKGYSGEWIYADDGLSASVCYTPIEYKVTFIAEGEIISQQSYTITNKRITEPSVPEKAGYTAKWESYELNLEDITVKAIYTPIEYKVIFEADGEKIAEEIYTVENKVVYNPAIPEKTGYTAKWENYELNLTDITVKAVYTPVNYTVAFIADGKEVSVQSFTVENMSVTEPTVPEKAGYTAKWEDYTLALENINVKAVYTLIDYTATFKINGETVNQQKFNVENMTVTEPEIPSKKGYTAKWESYSLGLSDITINAVYELVNYTVTFKAEGVVKAVQTYNVENMTIEEPPVPEIKGYTAKWESYSLSLKNITVNAVYTPIEYKITFVVGGQELSSTSYTVENKDIVLPEVPAKEWHNGKWEEHTLETGDVTINAVYTLATYTASFKADGKEVVAVSYDYKNQNVEQSIEIIPAKANHRAVWEKYEVVPGGMTINARYIPKEVDEENAEEKFHFSNMVTDLGLHSFTGERRTIVENIKYVGEGILADIEYGVEITEAHITATYQGIITTTKELYSGIDDKKKFQGDVARLIKDDTTFDYFNDFYNKYF